MMIKPIKLITFKGHNNTYYDGENKIIEYYNDNNILTNRVTYDKFGRDILTNWFDEYGNNKGFMSKKYVNDGHIETCKTPNQEYIRTCRSFIKDGFKHYIEEFVSKTKPANNYCNESIRDSFGKLVKMISNGKVIL